LVAEGVGRLTVQNTGALIQLINDDKNCGFASPEILANPRIDGEPGRPGVVTWEVNSCEIDLSQTPQVTSDCDGVKTYIEGRVRLSAKRIVAGTISSDPINPVIPGGPDAVRIEINVEQFRGFAVSSSAHDNALSMLRGQLSFVAKPRLARSYSTGICAIATPNIEISEITYTNAYVNVQAEGRDFNVPVSSSDFWAVNGIHGKRQNAIGGSITVWGVEIELDEDDGLNPDYDAGTFSNGYACTEDLQQPVQFTCDGIEPLLAQGASRLTVQTFGMLAKAIENDHNCGFSSAAVKQAAQTQGEIGRKGSITSVARECHLNFTEPTVLHEDCRGTQTIVSGRVTLTATKRIEGRLTGNAENPVVPMRDDPAIITISSARFDNFDVRSEGNGLTIIEGQLSGQMQPRVALDPERGACSVQTSIARFNEMSWVNARVQVSSPAGRFETLITDSDLYAVNGVWGSDANLLRGKIILGEEVFDLPTRPEDDGLNPNFNAQTFDEAWSCRVSDNTPSFDCHFVQPIAQGASQLAVKMLGTVAGALESNTSCGFQSSSASGGLQTYGDDGRSGGEAVFTIQPNCEISFDQPTVIETDCNGTKTFVQGRVRAGGSKSIRGRLTGHPIEAAVPESIDAVQLDINADFDNFKVWMEPGGHALEIHSGGLAGRIQPRLAIDTVRNACAIPTPIASFSNLEYRNADVTVTSEDMKFRFDITHSHLRAQNGSKDGVTNFLKGHISIDGETLDIPAAGEPPVLDPNYDSVRFLSGFSCTENFRLAQSDAECSLDKTIAEGAARLIVQSLGIVTSAVNEDDDCGFESNLTDPDQVFGNPGQIGKILWSIARCNIVRALDRVNRPASEDCIDGGNYYEGNFVADARREVRGIRSDIVIFILRFFSIAPHNRDAVDIFIDRVEFSDFKAYARKAGEITPRRALTFHSGILAAHVHPIMGENEDDRGTFDIPTPVARMRNIRLRDAPITLLNEGMRFKATIDAADLYAFNGSYQGERNTISGTIVVDGKTFYLNDQPLDPDYDQQSFDESYACTRDLKSLIPPF